MVLVNPRSCLLLVFFLFLLAKPAVPQSHSADEGPEISLAGVMFYNVENLFDVKDDSLKSDEEFLPDGPRRWSYTRMKHKMTAVARVILNAGEWHPPVLVGLCEVENQWVVSNLIWETGLNNLGYRYVHFESPDERGIDVALLYRGSRFKVLKAYPVAIDLGEKSRPTRDVLYVKGLLDKTDTLHVLVNHWPSRLGGVTASHWKREVAANTVKQITDSVFQSNPRALLLLMGDFNETSDSELFMEVLQAGSIDTAQPLINTASALRKNRGTLKHQQTWSIFDHIVLSRSLVDGSSAIQLKDSVMRIIDLPFLLESDEVYGGFRPFRTYRGFKYQNGFSDHLPVWINLVVKRAN